MIAKQAWNQTNIVEEMLARGMPPNLVQGEFHNVLFAAFDTTTALLANWFDCLARQPGIVKPLQAEIAIVVRGRPLVEADVICLTHLRATILGTLRLHSPVIYHTRRAQSLLVVSALRVTIPFPLSEARQ